MPQKHRHAIPVSSAPAPSGKAKAATRQRMPPHDRERLIIAEATRYFAEHGLNAGTTELAKRIGITQPLLYKYFPTKDALIERIYAELLHGRWNPAWEGLLDDTSLPLADRLKKFYRAFSEAVFTYEHVRLFLFSGLSRYDFNRRYYDEITERVFTRIVRALRFEAAGAHENRPITGVEMELVQSLHAAIYHIAFRKWVHASAAEQGLPQTIDMKVDFFLEGARPTMLRMAGEANVAPLRRPGLG